MNDNSDKEEDGIHSDGKPSRASSSQPRRSLSSPAARETAQPSIASEHPRPLLPSSSSAQSSSTSSSTSLDSARRLSAREFDRLEWIQPRGIPLTSSDRDIRNSSGSSSHIHGAGVTAQDTRHSNQDEELWAELMKYAEHSSAANSPTNIGSMTSLRENTTPSQDILGSGFKEIVGQIEKLKIHEIPDLLRAEPNIDRNSSAEDEEDPSGGKDILELIDECIKKEDYDHLSSSMYSFFSQVRVLNRAFAKVDEISLAVVDIEKIDRVHKILYQSPQFVASSVLMGTGTLLDHIKLHIQNFNHHTMGIFVVVLVFISYMDTEYNSFVVPRFCDIVSNMNAYTKSELGLLLERSLLHTVAHEKTETIRGNILADNFGKMITALHAFITKSVEGMGTDINPNANEGVCYATSVLEILYNINERRKIVPYTAFYSTSVNEHLQIKEDYPKYKTKEGFSFCNVPFVLDTSTKSDILKVESMIQMRHELQDAFFRAMFIGVNSPYLILEVRRDNLIRDAMYQLEGKSEHDLKKQLRVSFVGEDGIDEGGVQKEFFQLVVKDMFDAKYGMFAVNADSRLGWFPYQTIKDDGMLEEYKLVGRVLGLAIYNGVALDLHFPLAFYKKLIGEKVGLEDLKLLDPDLAQGFETLLGFDGDVSDVYDRNFVIEVEDGFGNKHEQELLPHGATIKLTNINRQEFVDLYVEFILTKSCHDAFTSLKEGFYQVMMNTAISLFRAEELEQLICGSPSLDFKALETVTQYDGFDPTTSQTVKFFWEVVQDFPDETKKKLLFFATGSDRVPIGGLGKLQFIIAKNGSDGTRLPTSHTCYNVLMLSEYETKEQLKERLLTALEFSECGFYLN